jgi:predicted methyltransferase
VLEFFGLESGMKVIDIFAGGGYYAEILSYAVGIDGEVTLYNNGGWDGFVGAGVEERLVGNRLPNVQSIVMEANELLLEESSYDVAVFVLGFHDLYYEEASWPAIDADDFVARLYGLIKPGGILGIVDHAADSGVSVAVANTLHRIDPGIIRSDLVSAGFEFVAESDVLRNQGDDRNKPMSDPSVRGKTDRVVMKFRKPGS